MRFETVAAGMIAVGSVFGMNAEILRQLRDGNSGEPVIGATVMAMSNDSTIKECVMSDANGVFSLYADSILFINIKSIGFKDRMMTLDDLKKDSVILLNSIPLELNEIVVNATKPSTKLEGPSLVTNIAGTYLSRLSTADEVLGWLPNVYGQNGKFEVFGKGKPDIYINGRKISGSFELEQLYADKIKEVRVISNPGPRYGGSVKSVIEITTVRNPFEGLGVRVRERMRSSNYFCSLSQLNLAYQTGKFDFRLVSLFNRDKMKFGSTSDSRLDISPPAHYRISQTAINTSTLFDTKITANYIFNPDHQVGLLYDFSLNNSNIPLSLESTLTSNLTETEHISTYGDMDTHKVPTHRANLYYSGNAAGFRMDMNLDFYYSRPNRTENLTEYVNNSESPDKINTLSNTTQRLWAQKFDISKGFGKFNISIGEEFTKSSLNMSYANKEEILPESNVKVSESCLSAFAAVTFSPASWLELGGGLRYEHTVRDYFSDGLRTDIPRNLDMFYPNANVSFKFMDGGVSFTYAKKDRKPSYSQLDGAVRYVNAFNYQQGNPFLKHTDIESFELLSKFRNLILDISLKNYRNIIMSSDGIINDNIILTTYNNYSFLRELDANLSYSRRIRKCVLQASAGVEKQWFKIPVSGNIMTLDSPIFSFSLAGSVKLPWDIDLTANYRFQTSGNSSNYRQNSSNILNISLYKRFAKGKWDVRLSVRDIINGQDGKFTTYSQNIITSSTESMNMRAFDITVRFNLNIKKDKYKGDSAGKSELGRM